MRKMKDLDREKKILKQALGETGDKQRLHFVICNAITVAVLLIFMFSLYCFVPPGDRVLETDSITRLGIMYCGGIVYGSVHALVWLLLFFIPKK